MMSDDIQLEVKDDVTALDPLSLTNEALDEHMFANMPQLLLLTGMSGAGRTEATHVLEDLGYFCIDNLPSFLISQIISLLQNPDDENKDTKIAIVCDTRNKGFFKDLNEQLKLIQNSGIDYRIIYLDADDEKLVSRYKASRRRHPLCENGMTILQGIQRERSLLYNLKEAAHAVINTTDMLPQQLRQTINQMFITDTKQRGLAISVYSFGFKHGPALDADLVIDVRFLPNPYWQPELRKYTGLDAPVRDYVMLSNATEEFMRKWESLLDTLVPGYVDEGKQQLAIAIGCTGGQHRSVAIAEETGEYLKRIGYKVSIAHRDLKLAGQ